MRSFKTEGLVLKSSNYFEQDKIFTIFTPHLGKISVIKKGGRRLSSFSTGRMQLLNLVKLDLYQTSQKKFILTQGQLVKPFFSSSPSLSKLEHYSYLSELLTELLPEEKEFLNLYQNIKTNLFTNPEFCSFQKIVFLKAQTLINLGFISSLKECYQCHTPITPQNFRFNKETKETLCPNCISPEKTYSISSKEKFILFSMLNEKTLKNTNPKESEIIKIGQFLNQFLTPILRHPLKSFSFN